MNLTYGEMFAGYAGLGLGVQSVLGGEMTWCAEYEAAPSRILAHHWPHVPNLGDVTKINWADVEPVDVITGGSPCQDLSHAGQRKGMTDGTRSNLWVQMREAVAVIRPRLVVWENVRGAYSACADSQMGRCPRCVGDDPTGGHAPYLRALGRVVGDLSDLGYDSRWYGLRAADVGGAHGRFRVFLFATPADADHPGLQERWDPGSLQATQVGAPTAVDGDRGSRTGLTLLPTPACNDMGAGKTPDAWDAWTDRMRSEHGNGNGHGKSLAIEAMRLLKTPTSQLAVNGGSQHPDKRKSGGHGPTLADEVEHLLPTPRATCGGPSSETRDLLLPTPSVADGMGGHLSRSGARSDELLLPGVAKDLAGRLLPTPRAEERQQHNSRDDYVALSAVQDWGQYEAAIRRAERATGRPAPAPTEPGAKGRPRLSARFVEWLMMLPDGHVTDPAIGLSRNDQLKALGNGVVPRQAAAATSAWLSDVHAERGAA